jgi:hydroxymethylpyrimidine/phosphomethylpyrimidine kinase
MTNPIIKLLSIAGFDGSCGAGTQADIKTFAALKCYGTSILTALTVQNTQGVSDIFSLPIEMVEAQFHSILSDIDIAAAKTGMLYNKEIVLLTAKLLKQYDIKHIVVDPVIYPTLGKKLQEDNAADVIKKALFPIATLITPNIAEAEQLTGLSIQTKDDMVRAAEILSSYGAKAILVKGGHIQGNICDDLLYLAATKEQKWFSAPRIHTKNNHGTGCSLASAITAFLGQNYNIEDAVRLAKNFITGAIDSAKDHQIGYGHGPIQHFWQYYNWR